MSTRAKKQQLNLIKEDISLGPWGDPPLTLFSNTAKGDDNDLSKGKGKTFGKDKGNEYGKAKGKHKTKDKRAFPYKGGPHDKGGVKGDQDFQMVKGKGKEGKDKGKGKNPNKGKGFWPRSPLLPQAH